MDNIEFITNYLESNGFVASSSAINNTVHLLNQDLTVPFIARYRKEQTNNLDAEILRCIEEGEKLFNKLKKKTAEVVKKIEKDVSPHYLNMVKKAKSIEEVEALYLPYKKGGKGTLAERARKLGLEQPALRLLEEDNPRIDVREYIDVNVEGIKTEEEVTNSIQHVIADVISKENMIYENLSAEIEPMYVSINTKKTAAADKIDTKKKYTEHYSISKPIRYLQNHQIMAINRAEKEKIVSVSLSINPRERQQFIIWMRRKWNKNHSVIVDAAIEDAFKRLIEKKFFRRIRTRQKKESEKESINLFSSNLKRLLLIAPVRENLISIDPGFRNGCKIAVIDRNGRLLDTAIIHPHHEKGRLQAEKILTELAARFSISLYAIGNGTACRETEKLVSSLISAGKLAGTYSIVDEAGASVYSVTEKAKEEFGKLDPNLISSVSIGRRLQDPLLELSKLDPKSLGVGMYQHDVDQKVLSGVLEYTISDCVNFVGVDINSCSAHMLKRISGISAKQADSIIAYRNSHGNIINREQLKLVKGIGSTTFNNCAGFIRIIPQTCRQQTNEEEPSDVTQGKKRKIKDNNFPPSKRLRKDSKYSTEAFDQTWIHPESYPVARKVLEYLEARSDMIGTAEIKNSINRKIKSEHQHEEIAVSLQTDRHTLKLILDGLKQAADQDLRQDFEKPVFKSEIITMKDLKVGLQVDGVVRNVTSFGVFVDIGVKDNGLIHKSELRSVTEIGPGDKVQCRIKNLDLDRSRIGLSLVLK